MMNLNVLNQYLVVIVVAICLCIGYVIKLSFSKIPNKYIPLIMAILGVILNIWLCGGKFTPEVLLGGLFSGLASTGLHQAFSQLINNKGSDKNGN